MKIYAIDWGWAGSATCIANSIEEAIEIFKTECSESFCDSDINNIKEQPVVIGLIHYNMGDR